MAFVFHLTMGNKKKARKEALTNVLQKMILASFLKVSMCDSAREISRNLNLLGEAVFQYT